MIMLASVITAGFSLQWMYIVPVVLFMLFSGGMQGGPQGGG